jgi:hypothetical protein
VADNDCFDGVVEPLLVVRQSARLSCADLRMLNDMQMHDASSRPRTNNAYATSVVNLGSLNIKEKAE